MLTGVFFCPYCNAEFDESIRGQHQLSHLQQGVGPTGGFTATDVLFWAVSIVSGALLGLIVATNVL